MRIRGRAKRKERREKNSLFHTVLLLYLLLGCVSLEDILDRIGGRAAGLALLLRGHGDEEGESMQRAIKLKRGVAVRSVGKVVAFLFFFAAFARSLASLASNPLSYNETVQGERRQRGYE